MKISEAANAQRVLFLILVIAAVFCSNNPKDNIISIGLVIMSFSALLVLWITNLKVKRSCEGLFLCLFLVFLVVTFVNALFNGVSFRDWFFRGFFPFCFLLLFFILNNKTKDDFYFYRKVILFIYLIWILKIFFSFLAWEGDYNIRWTVISKDLLFPYNLMFIPFLYFNKSFFGKYYWFLVILTLALTLGAGYRMQFILIIMFFAITALFDLVGKRSLRKKAFVISLFVLTLCTVFNGVGSTFVERIDSIRGELNSSRVEEIKYAYKHFYDSPIIGKGLAYPIPVEITFYGRENYASKVAARYEREYTHVTYMHNIVMYILMNSGIIGFVLFFSFIFCVVMKKTRKEFKYLVIPAKCALLLILLFNLTAATFTLFQYHLLIVLLSLLITNNYVARG